MEYWTQNEEEVDFAIGSAVVPKHLIQNYYRQQLDTLMQQKNRQKLQQKQEKEKEKHQYNQRIKQNNELEQLKTLSYKNYYQMLMENQNRNQTQIVPNIRDELKQGHITRNLQGDTERNIQLEIKLREREIKESYKQQLTRQMEEKRNSRSAIKFQEKEDQAESQRAISRLEDWQQKKKLSDQMNYKESLDRQARQKQISKSTKHYMNKINEFNIDQYHRHNPLNNPLPYNIQNPYILRQMMKSSLGRKQSYLSSIANNNL